MADNSAPALMDPRTLGILAAAFGGLQASGPSRLPVSLGQAIGQGGMQGLQQYQVASEAARRDAQTQAMIEMEKQKVMQAQAQFAMQQELLKKFGIIPASGGSQVPTGPISSGPGPQASPQGAPGMAGNAPTPAGAGSGDFPFDLNQIAAMKMAGLPDLTATYTAAHPPGIAQRPNAPITDPRTGRIIAPPVPIAPQGTQLVQDPNSPGGWKAIPIPGAAAGAAAMTGAVKGAESEHRTVEVTMADGRKVRVPESVLINQGGMGATPAATPQPMVPQGDRAIVQGSFPSANINVSGVKKEDLQKAADQDPMVKRALQDAGVLPDPWNSIPKMETPQGLGQTTFQGELQKEKAESASKISTELGTKANDANARIALNNQALDLVDKSDTGPLAGRIADVKNILVSRFNIPESDFENSPSATIALQKDLVNSATQRAKQQFGSRITQSEVNLMLSRGAPNVDMTKAAMKYLIQSDNAMSQYQIQQTNDFGKYLSKGGDPMQFEGWYSKNFPASQSLGGVHLDTGKTASQKFDTLPAAKDFKGKSIRDTTTGKILKSDGMSWKAVQ